ncbi:MAG TPA: type IV toxin-antitoxin system AbiEi family antitoxin [Polyangiaceae bacterium]|nr:type IV toxin-antitoxin system AbiEi family antitoxin [Polyangiaceae bacterium]
MPLPSGAQALQRIRKQFVDWFGLPEDRMAVKNPPRRAAQADLVLKTGSSVFVIEYKGVAEAVHVSAAVEQVKHYAVALGRGAVPVVAVPYMGDVGRSICERAEVSWMDLSGNAAIAASGVRIVVSGRPNLFKRRGRPSTVFAPKSSRVVRQLLLDPTKRYTQRELASATRLDEGFISRIVRRLESDQLLDRDESGAVKPANPNLLLDDWRASYDFSKHTVLKGHLAARSAEEVIERVHKSLSKRKVDHALTGLAAAWLLTGFAGFRLVTVYWREPLGAKDLSELGFSDEQRGANLWLVQPNDDGVFDGTRPGKPMRCVHPLQVYLDLKAQPERATEAAAELRKRLLAWSAK